jgi:hypothetical protein
VTSGSTQPEQRAFDLLMSNLTSAQRHCLTDFGYFEVTGGESGTTYRIYRGTQQNVRELAPIGQEVRGWCFYPSGALAPGDVMLAQKIALELFEPVARAIANKFSIREQPSTAVDEFQIRRYGAMAHTFQRGVDMS